MSKGEWSRKRLAVCLPNLIKQEKLELSNRKHQVFVLGTSGKPLSPTNWRKAKKLIKGGVAKQIWSKFNTFGIQMLVDTRKEVPETAIGIDFGTKFEGYSVVCGTENNLNINLILPNKKNIVKKLNERRALRRTRRNRLCRRPARFNNRNRNGFIAPSQLSVVNSRLKIIRELVNLYPVRFCGLEDVCFNHFKKKWGKQFSTIEIGKNRIRDYIQSQDIHLFEYKGWETKNLREQFGYTKISDKSKPVFEAHNSDSLSLAVNTTIGQRIEPNKDIVVVNDFYRPTRRKLHDTQFQKGHIKDKYSTGNIKGLRKGIQVGFNNGLKGQLIGHTGNSLYFKEDKKRRAVSLNKLNYISSQFNIGEGLNSSTP